MSDLTRLKRAVLAGGDPEAARAYLRELERRGRLARWEWLRKAALRIIARDAAKALLSIGGVDSPH